METNQQALPHGYVLQGEKNRYVIDRVLGQGAFGITFLARYRTTIQGSMGTGTGWMQVAVKEFFMRDLNTRDESTGFLNDTSQDGLIGRYRRAFMREARNLASLHHANIVNVFEVIETNNTVYIVMEYINGGSLDEHINQAGHLSQEESIDSMLKLCSAVGFMHERKMLHLDIKPKNVMLDEDGNLYLIDFGLSKQFNADGEPESSTTIGLGTPGYAPLEQVEHHEGEKKFPATLDIYALGATLYKMLTGNTPPKASQVLNSGRDNIVTRQLKESGVTDSLNAVVTKAMSPSSIERYQTVRELEKALMEIIESTSDGLSVPNPVPPLSNPNPTPVPVPNPVPDTGNEKVPVDSNSNPGPGPKPKLKFPKWLYAVIAAIVVGLIVLFAIPKSKQSPVHTPTSTSEPVKEEVVTPASTPNPTTTSTTTLPATTSSGNTGTGKETGHEWVDLGLSVMWATCNIGTSKPEGYGDYYAWGETNTKSDYSWSTYNYCNEGDNQKLTKYCNDSDYGNNGFTDNKTTLELSDDVTRVKWGGSWRMPTRAEQDELRNTNNCTWTWTTRNGVNGYLVTSKKSGHEGASIFLPAAGCRIGTSLYGAGSYGLYLSSSLDTDYPNYARYLLFYSGNRGTYSSYRYYGRSVRPVCQ